MVAPFGRVLLRRRLQLISVLGGPIPRSWLLRWFVRPAAAGDDSHGGRLMQYIYNSQGNAVAFMQGHYIFNMSGSPVGQLHGTHVHRLSGQYVGELHRDMIVNMRLGNLGNIGNPGNPGNVGSPGNPGNRGAVSYGYPDASDELLQGD